MDTGKTLEDNCNRYCRHVVIGSPANINAMICQKHAPSIPSENFTALSRLEHDRAVSLLASRAEFKINQVKYVAVWGNTTSTIYPDIRYATCAGQSAMKLVEKSWISDEYIPRVQRRGNEIINLRKFTAAASISNAAI